MTIDENTIVEYWEILGDVFFDVLIAITPFISVVIAFYVFRQIFNWIKKIA